MIRSSLVFSVTLLIVALHWNSPASLRGADRVAPGLAQLFRLDLLPQLKESVYVGSISSYDRTGGNDDGFSGKYSFVAQEGDGLVIADLKGPGVIYRIWTPTPTDDLLEFYFDGEKTPRIQIKFRDIFTGTQAPFVSATGQFRRRWLLQLRTTGVREIVQDRGASPASTVLSD